jgi:hypothetical protein
VGRNRNWSAALLLVVLLLAGCMSAHGAAGSIRGGPQLPPAVLKWLRTYAHAGLGRATSADWVLTTHNKSGPYVGAGFSDRRAVYLFDMHGHFVWNHSCPPGVSRSACASIGTDAVFTVDTQRRGVVDLGVGDESPDLAALGRVGHVAL